MDTEKSVLTQQFHTPVLEVEGGIGMLTDGE